MARPLRIAIEDGWYHVLNRGTERRIAHSVATRKLYIELRTTFKVNGLLPK
jgi:hypothetical protein